MEVSNPIDTGKMTGLMKNSKIQKLTFIQGQKVVKVKLEQARLRAHQI